MKIKFAVLAAVAALSAGSAFAAPTTTAWGTLHLGNGASSSFEADAGQSYDHYFSFTLDNTYKFFTTAVANNNDLSVFSNNIVTLQQKMGDMWSDIGHYTFNNTSTQHNFGVHTAGNYRVEVTADSTGSDTAYGTIQTKIRLETVPAVPEPETYALLLAGLGVVGFVARRRNPA